MMHIHFRLQEKLAVKGRECRAKRQALALLEKGFHLGGVDSSKPLHER